MTKNALIRDPREYQWVEGLHDMPGMIAIAIFIAAAIGWFVGLIPSIIASTVLYSGMMGLWATLFMVVPPAVFALFPVILYFTSFYKGSGPISEITSTYITKYLDLPRKDRALFGDEYLKTLKAVNPKSRYDSAIVNESRSLHDKIVLRNSIIKQSALDSIEVTSKIDRLKQSQSDLDIEIGVYQEYS